MSQGCSCALSLLVWFGPRCDEKGVRCMEVVCDEGNRQEFPNDQDVQVSVLTFTILIFFYFILSLSNTFLALSMRII